MSSSAYRSGLLARMGIGLLVSALAALGLPLVTAAPASASVGTGVVLGGTVTDSLAAPLAGVMVEITRTDGTWVDTVMTAADGTWQEPPLSGGPLAAGSFFVHVYGGDRPDIWYPNATSSSGAVAVTLADGQSNTGLDVSLPDGHAISGTVTVTGGASPAGVTVVAQSNGGLYSSPTTTVAADGTYHLAGLADGDWTLTFVGSASVNVVSTQYAGGAAVTIAGASRTGLDQVLTPGAVISGTITRPGAAPGSAPSTPTVYDAATGKPVYGLSATSGTDGSYSVFDLPAGSFKVLFTENGYAYQWWNAQTSQATAEAIPLVEGGVATAVNASLTVERTISGTVTDAHGAAVAGAHVRAYDGTPTDTQDGVSAIDGTFSLGGLRARTYMVLAVPPDDLHIWAVQTVPVGSTDVTGLTVALPDAGVVTGHVLRPDSSAVPSAALQLEDYDSWTSSWVSADQTVAGFDGSFRLGSLVPGTDYRLVAHDVTGVAMDTTSAAFTAVAGPQVQDVVMAAGGAITGTVTGAGSVALGGVTVSATNGTDVVSATTDGLGHYTIGGLPTGSYAVTFSAPPAYLDGHPAGVWVTAPGTTTLDRTLAPGATVSGTVVDGHGQPVAGVRVGVGPAGSDITCGSPHEATTAADGSFTVPGLTPGVYDVAFGFPGCVRQDANVVGEYWQDVAPGQAPTPVTLVGGQTVSLAAHVTRYAVVSGTVTVGGVASGDAEVSAWAVGASSPEATTYADGTGRFALPVPAGDYKLRVSPLTLPAYWYGPAPDPVLATVVSVATETDQAGLSLAAPFTGAIAGQVTSGGAPFTGGGTVEAYDSRDRLVASAGIGATGGYRIDGLPTGQYRLDAHGYGATEVWVGGTGFATATVQPVVDGATTTADIAIPGAASFGTIRPTVSAGGTPVTGDVQVLDAATGAFVTDCYLDPQFGCSGIAVPAGSYQLLVYSATAGYASTWYGGTSQATATVVTVAGGTDTPVSVALQPGGSLVVTVTNDAAALLSPVSITVSPAGGGPVSAAFSDSIGSGASVVETTPALAPGVYRVTAAHDAEVTTTTVGVLPGGPSSAALTLVSSAASETTGSITGLVQDGAGTGVPGVTACASYAGVCATTGADGSYTLAGIPAGEQPLTVSGLPAGTAVDGPLPWVIMSPLASTTSVAPVITLVSSATASGHVTLPGGGAASDAHVGLYQGDGLAGETYTDLTGAWSVAGLAPGSYTVETDSGSDAFEPVWYPSSATQSGATAVSLAAGATRTGLDLALVAGKAPVRVTVTSSSAGGIGSSVTLTATVVPADTGGATPTGTVQFGFDGTAVGSPVPLVNGVATVDVVTTQAQSTATVEYGGDSTYGSGSDSTPVLATATATTTTLVNPPTSALLAAAIPFDVAVADSVAGTTPTGWVVLHADDGTELGAVPLVGGTATITIHSLFVGTHAVWAEYVGDGTHQSSTSAPASIVVSTLWPTYGGIAGTVTSGPSVPVAGVTVDLYSAATGNAFRRETTTAADGTYAFGGLYAGSYLLRFSGSTVATTWWQGQSSIGSATPVAVTDGVTTTVSPVLAVTAPSGSLSGTVTAASGGAPVANAWVRLCATTGPAWCSTTQTDAYGAYAFDGLADATYHLLVQPWGVGLDQADATVVVSGGAAVTHDVALTALVVPPPSVTVTTADGVTQDNVPIATWSDSIPITYTACAAGTGTYSVTDSTGAAVRTGSLTEGPAGTYTGTIPPLSTVSGMLTVTASVACPSGPPDSAAFNLYVAPSGQVVDTNGHPVSGATVTLARFDAVKAAYVAVPSGSTVMSPANRVNPDTTDANGHFGWDVQPGHYRLTATKPGCHLPGSWSTQVSTGDLEIPPAVPNVQLVLDCMTPPTAPTGVTATAGDSSATVSWTAPASDGGSAITSYTVTPSDHGPICSVAAPASSCTVSGLSNGAAYTFTVTATNAEGTSPPSAPSAPVMPSAPMPPPTPPPPPTAPRAPSVVRATPGSNASAVVSWAAPSWDGGSPITAYTVTSSPGGATCLVAPPAVSCTVSGLANATAYTFTVTASNAVGTSAPSLPSAAVTTDGVAPTITPAVLPVATIATSVRVSWKAADIGSGLAGYAVRYERIAWNGTKFSPWVYPWAWQQLTSYPTVTLPVAAGFSYCVSVRARDRVGNLSAWSPIRCVSGPLDDRALVAGKGWVRGVGSAFHFHTVTSTKALGAVLVRTGARLDRVGIVATRCKACGVVGIYVANRLIGKINLYLSVTRYQQFLFLPKFSYRYGTVVIRSLTARKLVQVDGLVVIRT